MKSGSSRRWRTIVARTYRSPPASRAHPAARFRYGMKRRLTETMCGVPVRRATSARRSTSASDVPSGFSMTQGMPRSSTFAATPPMRATGITVTQPSSRSEASSSSRLA
jgi:hypothetical protein